MVGGVIVVGVLDEVCVLDVVSGEVEWVIGELVLELVLEFSRAK